MPRTGLSDPPWADRLAPVSIGVLRSQAAGSVAMGGHTLEKQNTRLPEQQYRQDSLPWLLRPFPPSVLALPHHWPSGQGCLLLDGENQRPNFHRFHLLLLTTSGTRLTWELSLRKQNHNKDSARHLLQKRPQAALEKPFTRVGAVGANAGCPPPTKGFSSPFLGTHTFLLPHLSPSDPSPPRRLQRHPDRRLLPMAGSLINDSPL